jgi:hypothetical protein
MALAFAAGIGVQKGVERRRGHRSLLQNRALFRPRLGRMRTSEVG